MSSELEQKHVVRDHFKDYSADWGARYGRKPRGMADLDLALRRENVHRLLKPLLAAADRTLRVLDLGCGSGNVLDGLPRDSLWIVGADLVPEMVAAAARAHPNDQFVVADAAQLPFAPNSLDLVTCLGVLEYVPKPERVLRSIHSALKPGGHLVMSFPNRSSPFRRLRGVERGAERALVRILDGLRGRKREAQPGEAYQHAQWSPRQAEQMLKAAGFVIEEALFNSFGFWGRVGRWSINLNLSRWLSRRFYRRGWFSAALACTMVVLARKTT